MTLTDHVRRYLSQGQPDLPFLDALADLIRERIRKSGMWEQPPDYLGYPVYQSWHEAFSGAEEVIGPACDFFLEEIVPEATFLEQTLSLGNAIDALLRQKVKWFLLDRQKKRDPIGYRTFMNLVAVLEAMSSEGRATVTNRVRGRIRNSTHVRFHCPGSTSLASADELAQVIDRAADWQPVLRRLAKLGKGAQRLLRERLDQFPSAGVGGFVVGELATLLKARVRAANEAWNRPVDGGAASDSTAPDPQTDFRTPGANTGYLQSSDDLPALHRKVRETIERSSYTPKVKRGMLVVLADWLKYVASGASPPPVREWAAQLGLSRSSLSDYQQRLKPLLRAAIEPEQAD